MFETFWSSAQTKMLRLREAVYGPRERPEEMVGSVETITSESWIHILSVRSVCFRPYQTKTNLRCQWVCMCTTCWEDVMKCLIDHVRVKREFDVGLRGCRSHEV